LLVREFAHGLVVANPAPRAGTVDLAALFPGRSWQRLQATPGQDVRTNHGAAVSGELELGAKDALFLRKR
jgi:hypothetical protein